MSENQQCFIIQPLTDEYKKRCDDTYKPAIEEAELNPYRADEDLDPKKLIIEKIHEGIINSKFCLAEISEDNPNVWYEIGFADGHKIPIVFICQDGKREQNKLPFDLNQRDVHFYKTNQGDWEALQEKITKILLNEPTVKQKPATKKKEEAHDKFNEPTVKQKPATKKKEEAHDKFNEPTVKQKPATKKKEEAHDKFGEPESTMLEFFYYDYHDSPYLEKTFLFEQMKQSKFSERKITDAFYWLKKEKLIKKFGRTNECYRTAKGKEWCVENKDKLREIKTRDEFGKPELTMLDFFYYGYHNSSYLKKTFLFEQMKQLKFSERELTSAFYWLKKEKLIEKFDGGKPDEYCRTDEGEEWCVKNKDKFWSDKK